MSRRAPRAVRRRWWVFGLAAAAAVAALAAVSWVVLAHERFQVEQQGLRARETKLEAAIWRMQSALLPALAAEWNRPEDHWRPLLEERPDASGPEGILSEEPALVPSPLLGRPESLFQLYFEWLPDGTWRSPHLPRPAVREGLIGRGWTNAAWLAEAEAALGRHAASGVDAALRHFFDELPAPDGSRVERSRGAPRALVPRVLPDGPDGAPELALLRVAADPPRVQGVLVDWPRLRGRILEVQAGLVRDARLVDPAVGERDPARRSSWGRLVLLPIEIELEGEAPAPPPFHATRALIGLAWVASLSGLTAVAVALASTLRESARRGRFASLVSHELRTPLTTFRMMSEMLARGMVPEDRRDEYLRTLVRESERLERVVDNVLQHTRVEQRRADLAHERLSLAELLERVGPGLERRALSGGLLFEADDWRALPEGVELELDVAAVEQILGNLVDNAVKYGAAGDQAAVRLRVAVEPRRVRLRVEDDGPGVPVDQRRRLFEPFVRDPRHEDRPGVGLGLSLARGLARDLGGDLSLVDDGRARGACFQLVLPRPAPRRMTPEDPRRAAAHDP